MAPPGSNKLRVRPLLGSTGNLEGCPCSATAEAARSTSGGERCDEGGVNCDLGSIPERKAVGNDLYSALVWPPRLDVQVPKEDVLLDSGSCFAANTGCCSPEGARHGHAVPQSAGMPRHGHQGRLSHDGYSSAACACNCPWSRPLAPAGVALAPSGTTVHHGPAPACCGPEPSRSKEPPHACAAKQERRSVPTSSCVT